MLKRLAALVFLAPAVFGGDAYLTVTLDEVTWTSPEAPPLVRILRGGVLRRWPQPEVRVGAGEAWLGIPYVETWGAENLQLSDLKLSVRGQADERLTGELWLPGGEGKVERYPFVITLGAESDEGRVEFLSSRYLSYAWRHAFDIPGGAWFRNRKEASARELRRLGAEVPPFAKDALPNTRGRRNDLDRSFDLFTGGRALAENLALDDALDPAAGGQDTAPIAAITGVTVPEIDWKPLIAGMNPTLDPLAARLPADQHAVFFPSFAALVRVLDELRANGAPVLELLDASSEDAQTQARYERQLALPLDGAARLLGGSLVRRVAVTGGDPYFRTGTDVAVLFETNNPHALLVAIIARQQLEAAQLEGVQSVEGQVGGVAYQGLLTRDRVLCSYVAQLGDDVVVTNSLAQLARLVQVDAGDAQALIDLDEYRWFRDRYRTDEEEDAFVVVSDATIRRWASPRWRIGASRRTRAAARLADRDASRLALALDAGRLPEGGGAFDPTYGTSDFLTPVGELELEFATEQEVMAYNRFNARYSRLWSQVFDPLAVRLVARPERLELDLSVRPIAVRSDYRDLIELTRGATLAPKAGDPHPGTALHFAMAFGRESRMYKSFNGFVSSSLLSQLSDPLSWLGDDVSVWLEDDPKFWSDAAKSGDIEDFLSENFYRMPIAARVPSNNPLKMTAFLTGLRSFIQGAAPDMVRYETRRHADRGYVAILPRDLEDWLDQPLAIYYVALPDAWVLSLREDVIQAVIDRTQAEGEIVAEPWLGESAALRLGPGFRPVLATLAGESWRTERQRLAWRALPILDEWRRLAPDVDPVELHRRAFGVTLRGTDGGQYGFDAEWNRSTCSVHGHPGAPEQGALLPPAVMDLEGVELGLTFEDGDGLRARVRLRR